MMDSFQVCRGEHGRDRQGSAGSGERARQLGQSVIRHGPYIVPITFCRWRQGGAPRLGAAAIVCPTCPFRGVASYQGGELGHEKVGHRRCEVVRDDPKDAHTLWSQGQRVSRGITTLGKVRTEQPLACSDFDVLHGLHRS